MREFEVKYTVDGVMIILTSGGDDVARVFYDQTQTTDDDIIEGIYAALEIDGNGAFQITSVTETTPVKYTKLWQEEVAAGTTLLGYDDWLTLYREGE